MLYILLIGYVAALALVGFWPVHVDQGMKPFLGAVMRTLPWLTYGRIEFGANVALFLPLGVLLMLITRRGYFVLPIALATTLAIECGQSLMGDQRTPDVADVVANLVGACLGIGIVATIEWLHHRTSVT